MNSFELLSDKERELLLGDFPITAYNPHNCSRDELGDDIAVFYPPSKRHHHYIMLVGRNWFVRNYAIYLLQNHHPTTCYEHMRKRIISVEKIPMLDGLPPYTTILISYTTYAGD